MSACQTTKPQISGTRHPATLLSDFLSAFNAAYPGELEALERQERERVAQRASLWDRIKDTSNCASSFSFGF